MGPLGVVSWGHVGTRECLIILMIDLEPIWRPKWTSRGAQSGPQHEPKSNTKIMIKYEGFQVPLESVLGPSWVVLGSILGPKIIQFSIVLQWFREHRVFEKYKASKCILDRCWVDVDARRAPKRPPKRRIQGLQDWISGVQNEAEIIENRRPGAFQQQTHSGKVPELKKDRGKRKVPPPQFGTRFECFFWN